MIIFRQSDIVEDNLLRFKFKNLVVYLVSRVGILAHRSWSKCSLSRFYANQCYCNLKRRMKFVITVFISGSHCIEAWSLLLLSHASMLQLTTVARFIDILFEEATQMHAFSGWEELGSLWKTARARPWNPLETHEDGYCHILGQC